LPQCASVALFREIVQQVLADTRYYYVSVEQTQFTAYELRSHLTPDNHEDIDQSVEELRHIIRGLHDLGYFGLIDLGRRHEGSRRCPDCSGTSIKRLAPQEDDLGYICITAECRKCGRTWAEDVDVPSNYPTGYLFCYSLLGPTGDPIRLGGHQVELVADQWKRYEDPRSLEDPQYRRGSYPTKTVLVKRPGTAWIEGKLEKVDDLYVTWNYYVPYDEGMHPSLGGGHYDMHPIEEGYVDYLIRLMNLSDRHDYELVY